MKNPRFRFRFRLAWLGGAALLALTGTGFGQPPEKAPKKAPSAGTKPQVIYHLPASSEYAATLHSQAKGPNSSSPVDGGSPAPPQISRENPNAPAPGRQDAATPPPQENRTKQPSKRSARPPSAKAKSHGNSRPNKSRKK